MTTAHELLCKSFIALRLLDKSEIVKQLKLTILWQIQYTLIMSILHLYIYFANICIGYII